MATHKPNIGLFNRVHEFVKTIPKGKVTTYGEIAKVIGTVDVRKIGWALHANKSEEVPCHRVVSKEGSLADNFAFNGWKEQRNRLEAEGVSFVGEKTVNLTKHLWIPGSSN